MNIIDNSEEIQHIRSLTNEDFAQFVQDYVSDNKIENLMFDVYDYKGEYRVSAYVKINDGSCHIFSFLRVNGQEDRGLMTLSAVEVDILKSL